MLQSHIPSRRYGMQQVSGWSFSMTPRDHLIANVRADQEMMRLLPSGRRYSNLISGSFPSYEAASKLINSTIARNADSIDVFLKSDLDRIVVRSEFSSPTGIEAYASSPYAQPAIRQTFGAGAVLLKDKSAPNGFTVFTAFPVQKAE